MLAFSLYVSMILFAIKSSGAVGERMWLTREGYQEIFVCFLRNLYLCLVFLKSLNIIILNQKTSCMKKGNKSADQADNKQDPKKKNKSTETSKNSGGMHGQMGDAKGNMSGSRGSSSSK